MTFTKDDVYYIDEEILFNACKDVKEDNPEQCPEAKALFYSFLLRVKFKRDYVFCPTEILRKILDGIYKDVYESKQLLCEAIIEDRAAFNGSQISLNTFAALLLCGNIKATDCAGKVKIVTTKTNIEFYKEIINKFKLPLQFILPQQATDELNNIHSYYLSNL